MESRSRDIGGQAGEPNQSRQQQQPSEIGVKRKVRGAHQPDSQDAGKRDGPRRPSQSEAHRRDGEEHGQDARAGHESTHDGEYPLQPVLEAGHISANLLKGCADEARVFRQQRRSQNGEVQAQRDNRRASMSRRGEFWWGRACR